MVMLAKECTSSNFCYTITSAAGFKIPGKFLFFHIYFTTLQCFQIQKSRVNFWWRRKPRKPEGNSVSLKSAESDQPTSSSRNTLYFSFGSWSCCIFHNSVLKTTRKDYDRPLDFMLKFETKPLDQNSDFLEATYATIMISNILIYLVYFFERSD